MSGITTHVLDTSRGRPAQGIAVALERLRPDGSSEPLGRAVTDADGRIRDFGGSDILSPGRYRLRFETGPWFSAQDIAGFFPQITVEFEIADGIEHQHVPLLLSPFGYSTYRGT